MKPIPESAKAKQNKEKREYRYQFLGYEEVGTGKFVKSPIYGLGLPLGVNLPLSEHLIEMKKKVAMVFDKVNGVVRQTEIEKL